MQTEKKKKIGVNEKCPCNSGLKYKKCCIGLAEMKYSTGQNNSSDIIKTCSGALKIMCEDHQVIDITNDLTELNYRTYQTKNYYSKIIMLAEKTESNVGVFESRVRDDISNIIVMYKGSYRTFCYDDLEDIIESVCSMITESDNRA